MTLTYKEPPEDGSLCYRDFQLFMKRLRKTGRRARFFMCGEYGDLNGRPHYHACLFNCGFRDRVHYRKLPSGHSLYTSRELETLWPHGFCSVGDVSFDSAAYVARYVLKKLRSTEVERLGIVDYSTGEMCLRAKEFVHMSLKPGIGAPWLAKFKSDVFPRDYVVINGQKCPVPRYYDKLVEEDSSLDLDGLQYSRYLRSLRTLVDTSESRLRVREAVTRARLSFKKRGLTL